MKWKPLGTRLLIEVEQVKEVTTGGIILPTDTADRHTADVEIGTVKAIGEFAFQGYGNGDAWVNVGDRVKFLRYSGQLFQEKNEDGSKIDYRVINDVDLLVVANKNQQ